MAQLPPDGDWLVQNIGGDIVIYHRYTEEEVVRYPSGNANATSKAQQIIFESEKLTDEQKCFAHFWCGYFYGHLG
jgi:hypothetical protein